MSFPISNAVLTVGTKTDAGSQLHYYQMTYYFIFQFHLTLEASEMIEWIEVKDGDNAQLEQK